MEPYEEFRPLMFSIAYRMTGSISDAEDIVQEAFVRLARATGPSGGSAEGTPVSSPKAYLATVTTRLAIDHLRSARVRRESYVGAWLPEPLVYDTEPDPAEHAEMSDSLSMAFLVLLESLSPDERAVFLLREAFGYDYDEIAGIVEKSEANCRQIFARARGRIEEGKPRFESSRSQREEVARRFLAAADGGDMGKLLELLAPDVVCYADGGGKTQAISRPVYGREHVARLVAGLFRQGRVLRVSFRPVWVNGQPGTITFDAEGRVVSVFAFDVLDGVVQAIRSVVNPDKLGHLGVVSDIARAPGRRGGRAP
ncbi:MAG: RNA polymerase sigma-70 factor [Micromonosporaceae bacterium]